MIKKLANISVPLYVAILVFAIAGVGLFFLLRHWTEKVYNYEVLIPRDNLLSEKLVFGSWPALANANFYAQVRESFIEKKANFIEADLSVMELRVYANGSVVIEAKILTKGKEGSWWETPVGLYRVEAKYPKEYSGFAGVYMPWSMPFEGNFIIHGWPYYPDGTAVNSRYSGGCIRLATEDAKRVYDLVGVGTPVLVYGKDAASDNFTYHAKIPGIEGQSYLVADLKNNAVLAELNSEAKLPIASLTKFMAALVAVEYVNIEKVITITPEMLIPTSRPRLSAGQKISLYNLLPLLLMESSNEAAEAIGHYLGPAYFVSLMNEKAKAIGMNHAHFADASGRSAGNVSTAQDLFVLAKHLYANRSFILNTSKGEIDTRVYGPLDYPDVQSFNGFIGNSGFVGGKVGLTKAAGGTFLGIFEIGKGEAKRPIAIILLNSPDELGETQTILDWITMNYGAL